MIHHTKQKINKKIKKLNKTKKKYIGGEIDTINDEDHIILIQKTELENAALITGVNNIPYPTIFDFLAIEYNHDSLGNYKGANNFNFKNKNPFYYGHLKELKKMYDFNILDTNNTNINLTKSFLNIKPTDNTMPYFNNITPNRGIDDLPLLAIMCCVRQNAGGINTYDRDIFNTALVGMNALINSPKFHNDWNTHIIPSAYKNNTAGMNMYDNFCSKCYMRSFQTACQTDTKNYKEIYEKMDNNVTINHKDYFITNDASALYSQGFLCFKTRNDASTQIYRSNIIFSTVHSCDQMTSITPESNITLIKNNKNKFANFKFSAYTDFQDYNSNNTVCTAFKYDVKSEVCSILTPSFGKRTIPYETSAECLAIFNNHTAGRNDGFKIENNELIMDQTAGIVSKGNIIKYIKEKCDVEKPKDANWYKRAVLIAQFKRLGDYSQIDYCYNLPSYIIDTINDTSTRRNFQDSILNVDMSVNLFNNTHDPNGGLSDLVSLIQTAGSNDEKIKILRKRIIHSAGDIPAFCWCIYNRINCIYFSSSENKMFVCIIDYDS